MKEIIEAVKESLGGVDGINYIGEDWGQLDNYDKRPPVKFPCVLFDIGSVEFEDQSQGVQSAQGSLTVRFADYRPMVGDAAADAEFWTLISRVHTCLHGLSGLMFSALRRRTLERVARRDGVREFRMEFTYSYTDNAAVQGTSTMRVPGRITVKRKRFE